MISIIFIVALVYALIRKFAMKKSFFAAFGLMIVCGFAATFMTLFTYAVLYGV